MCIYIYIERKRVVKKGDKDKKKGKKKKESEEGGGIRPSDGNGAVFTNCNQVMQASCSGEISITDQASCNAQCCAIFFRPTIVRRFPFECPIEINVEKRDRTFEHASYRYRKTNGFNKKF